MYKEKKCISPDNIFLEIWKSLHSVLIYIVHSIQTLLELGLYLINDRDLSETSAEAHMLYGPGEPQLALIV